MLFKTLFKNLLVLCLLSSLFGCEKKDLNAELSSTKWKIVSMEGIDTPFNNRIRRGNNTLEFISDSHFLADLYCNYKSGSYSIDKNGQISFNCKATTQVGCGADDLERIGEGVLFNATSYYVKGDVLVLDGNGRVKLKRQ